MKLAHIFTAVVFLAFSTAAFTQPLKPGTYKASNPGWLVDLQKANVESSKTGKPILINFTGSDWCGWCKKLRREVFDTPEFKAWAKENVVLLEADFPRTFQVPTEIKQQNSQLQQALGIRGYPTICIVRLENNDQGQIQINQLGRLGYMKGGPKVWCAEADKYLGK